MISLQRVGGGQVIIFDAFLRSRCSSLNCCSFYISHNCRTQAKCTGKYFTWHEARMLLPQRGPAGPRAIAVSQRGGQGGGSQPGLYGAFWCIRKDILPESLRLLFQIKCWPSFPSILLSEVKQWSDEQSSVYLKPDVLLLDIKFFICSNIK